MVRQCVPECLIHVDNLAAILGYTFNTLLVYLLIFKSPQDIRNYSKVLLFNCVADTMFSTLSMLTKMVRLITKAGMCGNGYISHSVVAALQFSGRTPFEGSLFLSVHHIEIRSGVLFASLHGIVAASSFSDKFTISVAYVSTLYATIAISSVPFAYRYFALCRNKRSTFVQLTAIVLLALALSSVSPLALNAYTRPSGAQLALALPLRNTQQTCRNRHDIPYFRMDSFAPAMVAPILAGAGVCIVAYSVILLCSYRIWIFVKRSTTMSRKTQEIHAQLTRALLAQAVLPLILNVIRLITTCLIIIFGLERVDVLLIATTTIFAWIPALNPLLAIYFVKHYRQTVTKFFKNDILAMLPTTMALSS